MNHQFEDRRLLPVLEKVRNSERLSGDDGLALYRSPDLLAVGYMANLVRERRLASRGRPGAFTGTPAARAS